ncbi:hypothetical protein GDO78_000035 [Eleutherodactylus coqui]|uniref:Uncharacterized protein n=1 Tax=Eleutherodactylus coqui TaxID=57060 RepID=A0A8J6FNW9_ELECQ|nr:hypothetical protein GDO78_000035 [Eleutherodactylus coqui]
MIYGVQCRERKHLIRCNTEPTKTILNINAKSCTNIIKNNHNNKCRTVLVGHLKLMNTVVAYDEFSSIYSIQETHKYKITQVLYKCWGLLQKYTGGSAKSPHGGHLAACTDM